MAQWGKTDDAASSVLWAAAQLNKEGTTTDRTNLFGNTTSGAFVAGQVVGQFGVDESEARALRLGAGPKVAHPGWILRREGTGGRAGRITNETLVAMSSMSSDASDDTAFPDAFISITLQPVNDTANSSGDEVATFTVGAQASPAGTLTYLWYYTTDPGNTASFATTLAVGGFSGQTTATLSADANTITDGTLLRVVVSSVGVNSANSDNAELTVTT